MSTQANSTKGAFITLEGDDGVGKSTQADLLAQALAARGREVLRVHEPGGTQLGEKIRVLLLSKEQEGMVPLAELMLYEAARAQVMAELIEPALAEGKVVICDRFTDSTLAYQGYGRELDIEMVKSLNALACGGRFPDRTLVLVLDPELAEARVLDRSADGTGDRMESAGSDFHARLRDGFMQIAASEPQRVHMIDASGTPEEVQALIREDLADLLGIAPNDPEVRA